MNYLPAELAERANRPRRPHKGRTNGLSSFQTHRIIVKEDGTKVRVMRNMGDPDDVPMLPKDSLAILRSYGKAVHRTWWKGRKGVKHE